MPKLASLLVLLLPTLLLAQPTQLIEVRTYGLKSGGKAAEFDRMMKDAAIPAMKRLGVESIGVFKEQPSEAKAEGKQLLKWQRIVVIPYPSASVFVSMTDQLAKDESFTSAASGYLQQDKDDPSYARIDSVLLKSFAGMPKLKIPGNGKHRGRIFELRTYESFSELKGKAKVAMFNNGEIDLFNRVGLHGLFYGEAIAGKNLPQLTYMLVHENAETKKANWKTFVGHPEWKTMKNIEEYKDTVSKISVRNLVATDYSDMQ